MKKLAALLFALMLSLSACGEASVEAGKVLGSSDMTAPSIPLEETKSYDILDPRLLPEGGVRDGVVYTAYDGVVEHLLFHPVIAYPE